MSIVYNNGIHVSYVDATLHNIGANQDIIFLVNKVKDPFFKNMALHLAMRITNAQVRTKTLYNICHFSQTADPVINKKYLSSPFRLKINSVPNNILIVHLHLGLNGLAVG